MVKMKEKQKREQYVLSTKGLVKKGLKYLSPKGARLILITGGLDKKALKAYKEAIWAKYGKNRYRVNPEAHIVKRITHQPLNARQ